jgi:hypothetical protein
VSLCLHCVQLHLDPTRKTKHAGHVFALVNPLQKPRPAIQLTRAELAPDGSLSVYGLKSCLDRLTAPEPPVPHGQQYHIPDPWLDRHGPRAVRVDVHPDGRIVYADATGLACAHIQLDSISFKISGKGKVYPLTLTDAAACGPVGGGFREPGMCQVKGGVVFCSGHVALLAPPVDDLPPPFVPDMLNKTVRLTGVVQNSFIYAGYNDRDKHRKHVLALKPNAPQPQLHDPRFAAWRVEQVPPVEGQPTQIRLFCETHGQYLYVADGSGDRKNVFCWKMPGQPNADIWSKARLEVEEVLGSPGVVRLHSAHHPGRPYIYTTLGDFDQHRRHVKAWCGAGGPDADILARAQLRVEILDGAYNVRPPPVPGGFAGDLFGVRAHFGHPPHAPLFPAAAPVHAVDAVDADDPYGGDGWRLDGAGGWVFGNAVRAPFAGFGAAAGEPAGGYVFGPAVAAPFGAAAASHMPPTVVAPLLGRQIIASTASAGVPFGHKALLAVVYKDFAGSATGGGATMGAATAGGAGAVGRGCAAAGTALLGVSLNHCIFKCRAVLGSIPLPLADGVRAVPGAKYSGVARFVISSDMVFLYGLLEMSPNRSSTSLALLPEAARPTGVVQLLAIADGGDEDRDQMLVVVNVFPSGKVELAQQSTRRVRTNRRVALDGVRFKAGAASVELDVPGGVDSQRPGGLTTYRSTQFGTPLGEHTTCAGYYKEIALAFDVCLFVGDIFDDGCVKWAVQRHSSRWGGCFYSVYPLCG